MAITINFNALSLTELKEKAIALNAKVEGDRRLKATWVKACELAQSALQSASETVAESLSEFTGCDLVQHGQVFGAAVIESYGIAHTQFVVPVEKGIAWGWNYATSDRAMRFYVQCGIVLMRFCFAFYKSGMIACKWYEAVRSETETGELSLYEVTANQVVQIGIRAEALIWQYDAQYQEVVKQVKDEVRSVFNLGEWVALLIV